MKFLFAACVFLCPVFAFANDADATAVPSDVAAQVSADASGDCEAPADVTTSDASEDVSVDVAADVTVCEDAEVCTAPEVAAPAADATDSASDASTSAEVEAAEPNTAEPNVAEAASPAKPVASVVPGAATTIPLWVGIVLAGFAALCLVALFLKSASFSDPDKKS